MLVFVAQPRSPELTKALPVGSSLTALLETIGLSDAYRWIAEQLPSAARPETKVVQRGSTMHVLTLEPSGRQRSRLTVRSIPSRLLERLLEVRALALGQARALSSRELEVADSRFGLFRMVLASAD